ncbi:hypothetical protein [Streptomyces sp. NRRL F-2580]|uniref:hypothetical protein n=1 Tax=Streptomyces sp. NRRL F-2580 TaxID=1463841 RepID=UPI000A50CCF8|nr:hypothetical protein [Streptomyces sp. NRRL F-2580]
MDRLVDLGFDPDYVTGQREALILARALVPEISDSCLTRLEHSLDDPEHVELTKRGGEARSWDPDEPRIEELAWALTDKPLSNRALLATPTGFRNRSDAASRYGLVNHPREDQASSIVRLNALVEANLRAAGIAVPHQ